MRRIDTHPTRRGTPRPLGLALALAFGTLLASQPAAARAPVEPRGPATAGLRPEPAQEIHEGRISGYDVRRGILMVDGQAFRVDPATTAFSDDRRVRPEGGLAGLRPGVKVIVRGVRRDGLMRATQLIARD